MSEVKLELNQDTPTYTCGHPPACKMVGLDEERKPVIYLVCTPCSKDPDYKYYERVEL